MSLVTIAAIVAFAVAGFVGGGVMFYSSTNRPTTTISAAGYSPVVDAFKALESLQAPPTTAGQDGIQ